MSDVGELDRSLFALRLEVPPTVHAHHEAIVRAEIASLRAERDALKDSLAEAAETAMEFLRERDALTNALTEETTRHHGLRWLLGLDTHEGEEPQSRSDSHRNLDRLLDAALASAPTCPDCGNPQDRPGIVLAGVDPRGPDGDVCDNEVHGR